MIFDATILEMLSKLMELTKIFDNARHQAAFEKWLNYVNEREIQMEPNAIANIAAVQRGPYARHLRAYSYAEYFGRAAWDKTMPPIDQVQIYDMKTPSGVPSIKFRAGC